MEVERARLTRLLARIAEERGNVAEAAEIMQEVAVETYGALCKEEKVAFVLEQVRLVLDRGDFVRAQILAKKVNPRTFADKPAAPAAAGARKLDPTVAPAADGTPSLGALKQTYFALMVRYHLVSPARHPRPPPPPLTPQLPARQRLSRGCARAPGHLRVAGRRVRRGQVAAAAAAGGPLRCPGPPLAHAAVAAGEHPG